MHSNIFVEAKTTYVHSIHTYMNAVRLGVFELLEIE